jgi:hypothetical protein
MWGQFRFVAILCELKTTYPLNVSEPVSVMIMNCKAGGRRYITIATLCLTNRQKKKKTQSSSKVREMRALSASFKDILNC